MNKLSKNNIYVLETFDNVSSKGTLSFIKNKSLEYKEYVKNIST